MRKSAMILDYPFKQGNFYVMGLEQEDNILNLTQYDFDDEGYFTIAEDLYLPFLIQGYLSSLVDILKDQRYTKENFNDFKGTDEQFFGLRDYI